jgi:hypothetical protein
MPWRSDCALKDAFGRVKIGRFEKRWRDRYIDRLIREPKGFSANWSLFRRGT